MRIARSEATILSSEARPILSYEVKRQFGIAPLFRIGVKRNSPNQYSTISTIFTISTISTISTIFRSNVFKVILLSIQILKYPFMYINLSFYVSKFICVLKFSSNVFEFYHSEYINLSFYVYKFIFLCI